MSHSEYAYINGVFDSCVSLTLKQTFYDDVFSGLVKDDTFSVSVGDS